MGIFIGLAVMALFFLPFVIELWRLIEGDVNDVIDRVLRKLSRK